MTFVLAGHMSESDLREWLTLRRLCELYAPWTTWEQTIADLFSGRDAPCN